jgi:hypothetical protein
MYPVIVCIAKRERDYIEEFVKYHLALGFKYIYLYDNEDIPTYETFLEKYKEFIKVIHLPHNNYGIGVQYVALDHFEKNYLFKTDITHVAHIDIDEFIVLKKHANICDFISEYIIGDCQGIAMNWRFFGSSGKKEKTDEPVTMRFTMCEEKGNTHIKTLYKKDYYLRYNTCHDVVLSSGYIKSTNGSIVRGPLTKAVDFSVIQLNHYKCKTLPEFQNVGHRGDPGRSMANQEPIDIKAIFIKWDLNEVEDLTARDFYMKINI